MAAAPAELRRAGDPAASDAEDDAEAFVRCNQAGISVYLCRAIGDGLWEECTIVVRPTALLPLPARRTERKAERANIVAVSFEQTKER